MDFMDSLPSDFYDFIIQYFIVICKKGFSPTIKTFSFRVHPAQKAPWFSKTENQGATI